MDGLRWMACKNHASSEWVSEWVSENNLFGQTGVSVDVGLRQEKGGKAIHITMVPRVRDWFIWMKGWAIEGVISKDCRGLDCHGVSGWSWSLDRSYLGPIGCVALMCSLASIWHGRKSLKTVSFRTLDKGLNSSDPFAGNLDMWPFFRFLDDQVPQKVRRCQWHLPPDSGPFWSCVPCASSI